MFLKLLLARRVLTIVCAATATASGGAIVYETVWSRPVPAVS